MPVHDTYFNTVPSLTTFQAIDSIHQVGVYCLALVPANTLPKTPLGGIHLSETKQLFLEGSLHPCNVLMCPHTCVTNLPKPRQKQPGTSGGPCRPGGALELGGATLTTVLSLPPHPSPITHSQASQPPPKRCLSTKHGMECSRVQAAEGVDHLDGEVLAVPEPSLLGGRQTSWVAVGREPLRVTASSCTN